jgi:hypothetical protein
MPEGNKPDFHVCVGRVSSERRKTYTRRVGAAWTGEKGQVNLQIDVDLCISRDTQVVLFPNEDEERESGQE